MGAAVNGSHRTGGVRILHIVAGLPPGGGIAGVVPTLCRHLCLLGHEVTLATLDGPLSEAAQAAEAAGVRLVRFAPSFPCALYFSWQMLRGLPALVRAVDVVHVHSLWTFPVWWGCRCALRARKPLVMSPHGCLDPVRLRHSAWKKRLVGWIDRWCLRRAAVVHATSEMEREWVMDYCDHPVVAMGRVKGNGDHPVAAMGSVKTGERARDGRGDSQEARCREREERIVVIPNGVEQGNAERRTQNVERRSGERKTVLYLGRLHPLKGLDLLVEAWGRIRSSLVHYCDSAFVADGQGTEDGGQETRDEGRETEANALMNSRTNDLASWRLVVAGPDEQGTLKTLKEQVARLGLEESVVFADPVYGEEKWRMMAAADIFVLPTRSENFGIVVAEALACGVPVVTTKGAPWAELLGYCDHPVVAMGRVKGRGGHPVVAMGRVKGKGGHPVVAMGRVKGNGGHPVVAMGRVKAGGGQALNAHGTCDGGTCGEYPVAQGFNLTFVPTEWSQKVVTNELPPARTGCAGWWVDVGVEPLAEALHEAMSLTDEERRIMGENGRRLVESKYRWESVAQAMCGVYERVNNE